MAQQPGKRRRPPAPAGPPPVTIWLTGLSAAGKSTIAYALERTLIDQGRLCFVLDGDNVRHGLNNNVGFSPEDRSENIRRVAEVAKLMNAAGLIVIAAFISPYAQDRRQARDIIGAKRFREVYVSTSLAVCEREIPRECMARQGPDIYLVLRGLTPPMNYPNIQTCSWIPRYWR